MNINKHNYEAFFLDYYEGKLTPNEVAELLLFIEQHPEVKEDFDSFENITLDNSSFVFENKEELKKEITFNNKDEYFIKAIEGNITKTENELLNSFLKQHPQSFYELELYKKTKLYPELNIVFDNKDTLKQICTPQDELLISALENQLSLPELELLNQQFEADISFKSEYALFQKTKLKADSSVVYENKEKLKRKEKKIIPLYFRYAAAAAILLLFGLFYIFNKPNQPKSFAHKNTVAPTKNNGSVVENKKESTTTTTTNLNAVANTTIRKNKEKNNFENAPNNTIIENKITPPEFVFTNNEKVNEEIIVSNNNENAIANANKKENESLLADNSSKNKATKNDYLSLKETVATKIKEKTFDVASIENQKENGRIKKFNFWDVAQVVANGISKLTGKEVIKVKPEYNEEGAVTAYALGAGGFEISKGK